MDIQAMSDAITATYRQATLDQRMAGRGWYRLAYDICHDIARASGHAPVNVAAAMAHLSPRTKWDLNIFRTWELCMTGTTTGLSRSVANAQRALVSDEPSLTFGPSAHKTRAFYGNIIGALTPVTVDVWAARVAGVPDADLSSGRVYSDISLAYKWAAAGADEYPAHMQAITWVVARGSAV
jgi:hypothetical protein